MQTRTLLLLFLFSSILFIFCSLFLILKPLYLQEVETQRVANIQIKYRKTYLRKREEHIPQRSMPFAEQAILQLLSKYPIFFEGNSFSLENNRSINNHQTLTNISNVLNNMTENAILNIETHTDTNGTQKDNLQLSQERADQLKSYIVKRTKIPFISAIGYGEEIPLNSKEKRYVERIKFNLRRIIE